MTVQRKPKGFTLIELMVAVSIIAILSAIGMTVYSQSQKLGRDSKRKQDLEQIQNALNLFYQDFRRFPCSGADWVYSSAANWLTDSSACGYAAPNPALVPTYISSMPKDPLRNDSSPYTGTISYAYFSPNAAFGNPATTGCLAGQYFVLVTHLENASDPQRNTPKTVCGVDFTVASYGANAYIVAQP